jgi:hypothetical protein
LYKGKAEPSEMTEIKDWWRGDSGKN